MTLNNATRSVEYPGAGSAGPFAYPFKIFDQAHLVVTDTLDSTGVATTLALGVGYTVSGVGRAAGSILLTAPLAVGHTLKIRRRPPLTQLTALRDEGPYFPNVMEDRFDLAVMQMQGVGDDLQVLIDALQAELDAFELEVDARLDSAEARITALETAQILAQSGAALPVPYLLDPAAADVHDDGATLRWRTELGWLLEIATSADFAIDMVPGFPATYFANTDELSLLLAGLEPETEYWAQLQAVSPDGQAFGEFGNVIHFTTEPLFVADGGDLVTFDGVYSRHYFWNSGTFSVLSGAKSVRAVIVAGGGSGGSVNGSGVACGGGGGGGVLDVPETDWLDLVVGDYPVVVGIGGVAPNNTNYDNGDNSSFHGKTAIGGGGGGSAGGVVGSGGCGGGCVNSSGGPEANGLGRTGQGYDGGGPGNVGAGGGGGGGGAGQDGEQPDATKGGKGGDGKFSDITDGDISLALFAGDPNVDLLISDPSFGAGGGGCIPEGVFGELPGTVPGVGGSPGGGRGATDSVAATAGSAFGAGGGGTNVGIGKSGFKGVVIIKYKGHALTVSTPPVDPSPPVYHGPIPFAACARAQALDGVNILIDCNSDNSTGPVADYLPYQCLGGVGAAAEIRTARVSDGQLVFRFDQAIRSFRFEVQARPQDNPENQAPYGYAIAAEDYPLLLNDHGNYQDGYLVDYHTQVNFGPAHDPGWTEVTLDYAPGFHVVVMRMWAGTWLLHAGDDGFYTDGTPDYDTADKPVLRNCQFLLVGE